MCKNLSFLGLKVTPLVSNIKSQACRLTGLSGSEGNPMKKVILTHFSYPFIIDVILVVMIMNCGSNSLYPQWGSGVRSFVRLSVCPCFTKQIHLVRCSFIYTSNHFHFMALQWQKMLFCFQNTSLDGLLLIVRHHIDFFSFSKQFDHQYVRP